ncbi:MAG: glycosyltransferase family 4 protein [Cytophagales bacterium]
MKVIELLNSPPGEFFIQRHLRILSKVPELELYPAYWQTSEYGLIKSKNFQTLKELHFFNRNRQSRFIKTFYYLSSAFNSEYYLKRNLDLIKKIDPDLIHFHFAPLAIQLKSHLNKLDVPYTLSFRGSELLINSRLDKKLNNSIIDISKKASGLHFVSNSLKAFFNKNFDFDHPNTRVIYTNIDANLNQSKEVKNTEDLTLIFVGRLHWVKSIGDILVAIQKVNDTKANKKVYLKIIGDGPEYDNLNFMVQDLSIASYVKFYGKLDHESVNREILSADALILSSISEGFPNVIAEAVRLKIPVITSRLKGISEFFNENDMLYYTPGNPTELSKLIIDLSQMSKKEIEQMTTRAFDKSSLLVDEKKHSNEFVDFYSKALSYTSI